MSDDTTLRKPSEQEQMVIVAAYRALGFSLPPARPERHGTSGRVVAIALGASLLDDEHGRWTTIFGLPVTSPPGMDPRGIGVVVQTDTVEKEDFK